MTTPTRTPVRPEPAGILSVVFATIAFLVTFHWHGLSSMQGALIIAAINAVGGAIIALRTRPVAVPLIGAAIAALFALGAAYSIHVSPAFVATLTGLVMAGINLIGVRHQVTAVGVRSPV